MDARDTIAAISTAMGNAGIGIIKISGPMAIKTSLSFFRQKGGSVFPEKKIISHKMIHGWIVNPQNDEIIDEVLWVCMKSPNSYTGEDVAEIHTHGNHIVLQSILELIVNTANIRLAKPGEFTRRAYMNGRIDLTHAEAVMDVISAQTQKTLSLTSSHFSGYLKQTIDSMKNEILQCLANIEAIIDFPEDMEDEPLNLNVQTSLSKLIDRLNHYIANYYQTSIYRDGVTLVIVGRPNVGKSSLLNCLLGKDRAIVSEQPGTTRDTIDGQLTISNIWVSIFDTAGIHVSNDNIEQQGISKAKSLIKEAHLILFVVEAGKDMTSDDLKVYQEICHQPFIICANKIDCVPENTKISNLPEKSPSPLYISALHHKGIVALKQSITDAITIQKDDIPAPTFMINLRQKKCLETAKDYLEQSLSACLNNMPLDCVVIDIRLAMDALGEITGEIHNEQMLDQIFSTFCIG
ncbi:tRNA modification GTPase TrmE, partial [Candidatus Magnetomorum sp. HK-1]